MKIEFDCKICPDGYEVITSKLKKTGRSVTYLKPRTRKVILKPLPDDAYTKACVMGYNLKNGEEPYEEILEFVHEVGSLDGCEGMSKTSSDALLSIKLKHKDIIKDFEFPFPTEEAYTKYSISLYEQRLDMKMGLPDMALEKNLEGEFPTNVDVSKKVIDGKMEIVLKPSTLRSAIDLQFVMNQGMVKHYLICEWCKKPFTPKRRSDAKTCVDKTSCKTESWRAKQKMKGAKK